LEKPTDHAEPGTADGPIGHVISVRGSEANVGLPAPWPNAASRATVGKYLIINAGPLALVGMIVEVSARHSDVDQPAYRAEARMSLMGEIRTDADGMQRFRRGVSDYPAIGDAVSHITPDQLRVIYSPRGQRTINIGYVNNDSTIPAYVDVDNLVSKHFAVLGTTGVGKSSGVTVLLNEIMKARPDLRVFLLDGHNEYGASFGTRANVISPRTLKLPFWLFNFEELTDVIYGGRPGIPEELEILAEAVPAAKSTYLQYKSPSAERLIIKKTDAKRTGFTVDTPVPYLLQDLVALIDERMGKLENRSSRMNYHRLMMRIDAISNDPRYAFMFENASLGGDTMPTLLSNLFRLEPDGKPMSIMQLAGLPVEVVDAVVCVVCRLAFDFGLWSDGVMPLLFVCEEAHRYVSADRASGFGPTRRALSRIAKEGRKYGVTLGLVTQRPAELDPTIISQCSTLFAMRLANDRDQALLRSAVADAAANLLDFVPSLGTGEVVGFGEGMPIPARLTFSRLPRELVPQSETAAPTLADTARESDREFVKSVVERWRGAIRSGEPGRPYVKVSAPQETVETTSGRLDETRKQVFGQR
jgi:DNA helicase HerA-like ATPase